MPISNRLSKSVKLRSPRYALAAAATSHRHISLAGHHFMLAQSLLQPRACLLAALPSPPRSASSLRSRRGGGPSGGHGRRVGLKAGGAIGLEEEVVRAEAADESTRSPRSACRPSFAARGRRSSSQMIGSWRCHALFLGRRVSESHNASSICVISWRFVFVVLRPCLGLGHYLSQPLEIVSVGA